MKKKICWPVFLYISIYHLLLLGAIPTYFFLKGAPSAGLVWTTIALVFMTGLAITASYHRLYSHNAYKIHPAIEAILLFFGSMATEGSALRWSYDHRLHHAFVDKERDPYSVKKGFWHAHILWLFKESEPIDPKVVSDLWRKKLLRFQNDHYIACMLVTNTIVFLFMGWLFSDFIGAFLFTWVLRMFLLHHTTWSINSLAHYWGTKSYSEEHSAVDNYLISLLTYGEGYHNYHHTFANDYRNGIRWYHFDPTKWLIWTLSKFGLAYDLKKISRFRIQKELLLHDRDNLLKKLTQSFYEQREQIEARVIEIHENLSQKLSNLQTLIEKARDIPRTELLLQIRNAKVEFKAEWRRWKETLRIISKLKVKPS